MPKNHIPPAILYNIINIPCLYLLTVPPYHVINIIQYIIQMRKMMQCSNPTCGKTFTPKSYIHRFCSDRCRRAARGASWGWVRKAALIRDQHTCQECGVAGCRLEVHHIVPVAFGGESELYNVVTLCVQCHRAKHRSWRMWQWLSPKSNYQLSSTSVI